MLRVPHPRRYPPNAPHRVSCGPRHPRTPPPLCFSNISLSLAEEGNSARRQPNNSSPQPRTLCPSTAPDPSLPPAPLRPPAAPEVVVHDPPRPMRPPPERARHARWRPVSHGPVRRPCRTIGVWGGAFGGPGTHFRVRVRICPMKSDCNTNE